MNKYLEGYLSSIPKSEYNNVIKFLKEYAVKKLQISEDEFEILLNEIEKYNTSTTEVVEIDPHKRPRDTYNEFFSKASVDLAYLYKIINSLFMSIENYSHLSSSYFSDIKNEVDKLKTRIEEFKYKREYDSNTIVISEDFKTTRSFEEYNDSTKNLFADRDGQHLKPVDIVHNNADSMISLSINSSKDLLHNNKGKTVAAIEVLDYRGVPQDTYYGPKYAIDSSDITYWDCSVLSKAPIEAPMDNFEPGGAYMKFKILLSNINNISEISITPYGIYPVEIAGIIIEGKNIISGLINPKNVSTDTMTFNIPPVSADEVTIIMRQKNSVFDTVITNQRMEEAKELWATVTGDKKTSFIEDKTNKTEYKDIEIYNRYIQEKEKEIDDWNKNYLKGV